MGAFLDKPKTEKHNEEGTGGGLGILGLRFGLSSMQGWRVEMEDAHVAILNIPDHNDWAFFAVFDGHAGDLVSTKCAHMLLEEIKSTEEFKKGMSSPQECKETSCHTNISDAIRIGFLNLDNRLQQLPEVQQGEDRSGSTAVCALVSPTHIIVGNCGDSRAVVYSGSGGGGEDGVTTRGFIALATQDHKPTLPSEKERIVNAGGSVMVQRVNGSLAVSRALGDFEYKNVQGKGQCEQLVSPEPELYIHERVGCEEFLVLACDGVWDVLTNEQLCDLIRSRMLITNDLKAIANTVVDTCLSKGSRDNMSIIIVAFDSAPAVCEEAKKKEEGLNQLIKSKVADLLKTPPEDLADLVPYTIHTLASAPIDGLPPGGGIFAKRDIIEETIRELGLLNLENGEELIDSNLSS